MCIRDSLSDDDYRVELNTIKHIALANGYQNTLIDNLIKKHKIRKSKPPIDKDTKITFISTAYTNIMPKILTSTFSKLNITATFKTNNSLLKILRHRKPIPLEKKSGIYKLSCNDCNSFYIGQTGRGFLKRIKEHTPKRHLNNLTLLNNIKPNFARHLILHLSLIHI